MSNQDVRVPWSPLVGVFGDLAMTAIWSADAEIDCWLRVESALASSQAELGLIPIEAAASIGRVSRLDIDRKAIAEGMRNVGYPILPLIHSVADRDPSSSGVWMHLGATTQDIMDTALALRLTQSVDRVWELLDLVGDRLAIICTTHRSTIVAARTHAQQAVPTTFGAKVAVWLTELSRHRARLAVVRSRVALVSLHGAGGTSAALGPDAARIRALVATRLGLEATVVPWHTARDSIAEWGFVLALIAATCGKIANEVIQLARTEIDELQEAAGVHRGASSTMPQKANPITSEVVVGFSRLAAAQVPNLLVAMQAGHERSAGEWQIEWDATPQLAGAAAGAITNTNDLVDGLVVRQDAMSANLAKRGGTLMAESVMITLAATIGRSRAHEVVANVVLSMEEGENLSGALRRCLDSASLETLEPLDERLDPGRYLGDAVTAADAGVEEWTLSKQRVPRDHG